MPHTHRVDGEWQADEALREYDMLLEAAVDEAVEWAKPPTPAVQPHVLLLDAGPFLALTSASQGSAAFGTAWEALAATGQSIGLLGFLQGTPTEDPAPNATAPSSDTTGAEQYDRAQVHHE